MPSMLCRSRTVLVRLDVLETSIKVVRLGHLDASPRKGTFQAFTIVGDGEWWLIASKAFVSERAPVLITVKV